MPVLDVIGSKEPESSARLLGRCVGEVVGGGLLAAVVIGMANGPGWLADFIKDRSHATTVTHQAFSLVGNAGTVLAGTLWLILVMVVLFKLIRGMLK